MIDAVRVSCSTKKQRAEVPGQSFIYQNGIKVVTFRESSKRSKISSESEFKQPVNFKIIFSEIANTRDGNSNR